MKITPAGQIAILIAFGMADLIPNIAQAAEERGEAAAMRGNDAEAVRWFELSDAADDAAILALDDADARRVTVAPGCDRRIVP